MRHDLKKYHGSVHQGPDHAAPYPVSRLAPAIELVDLAQQIASADHVLTQVACGKLRLIAEQMRILQAQAHEVMAQAQRDQALHRAQCNFQRQPGKAYHLYGKPDGVRYFSLLSPQEWGGKPPHEFLGTYRLENDGSWTAEEAMHAETKIQQNMAQWWEASL